MEIVDGNLSEFVRDDERVREDGGTFGQRPMDRNKRLGDGDSFGNVQKVPRAQPGLMECEELIPAEAGLMFKEVLFQQRRMMPEGIRE